MNASITDAAPKRRDKLAIMAEIIEICKKGALKTQIMYKGNLSFAQLTHYLKLLVQLNLLEKHEQNGNGKKVYQATVKGRAFLEKQRGIMGLLNEAYAVGKGMNFPL